MKELVAEKLLKFIDNFEEDLTQKEQSLSTTFPGLNMFHLKDSGKIVGLVLSDQEKGLSDQRFKEVVTSVKKEFPDKEVTNNISKDGINSVVISYIKNN